MFARTGLIVLLLLPAALAASAQESLFGSRDDPAELVRRAWWQRDRHIEVDGGFSLIGAQWRTATRLVVHAESAAGALRVDATARAGVYGLYGEDFDEPYDLLRLLDYARLEPTRDRALYARVGTLQRVRLGSGQLVNFLRTDADLDERLVGAEMQVGLGRMVVSAYTEDLLLSRTVGAHAALRPLPARMGSWGTLTLGGAYVSDLDSRDNVYFEPVAAYQFEARIRAARSGAFGLWPFISVADFTHYGRGLFFGADIRADPFIDIARIHFRVGMHYMGKDFVPGYFGPFHRVHQIAAQVVRTEDGDGEYAGEPLWNAAGGNALQTELRLHFLGRFELWYAFRRHYGYQALSEYHLRLFLNAERFRLAIGQDRAELGGFFSLFNDLGDLSLLDFHVSYRIVGALWLNAEAWYGFDRLESGPDLRTYVVERRFEPYLGLRIAL